MIFGEVLPTISYDDILLVPYHSDMKSRSEGNPQTAWGHSLPLIMSPMNTVCTGQMMKLFVDQHLIATIHRYFLSADEQYNFVNQQLKIACFEHTKDEEEDIDHITYDDQIIKKYIDNIYFSVGSVIKYKDWIDQLYKLGVRKFLIDMAHGDTSACGDTVKYIRSFGDRDVVKIIAGNVATRGGYRRLRDAGADGIRVGIGGGSICSTRTSTGFGVPTLTSIIDCNDVKGDTFMIADGGIKNSGDIVKAIRFGADYVMCGKLLAGTEYGGGVLYNSLQQVIYENPIIKDDEIQQYKKLVQILEQNPDIVIKECDDDTIEHSDLIPDVILKEYRNNPFPLITKFPKVLTQEETEKFNIAEKGKYILSIVTNYMKEHLVTMRGYCGMASREARGTVLSYSSVEGKSGLIKYTGSTIQLLTDIKLNLQAALSYGGSRNWTDFRQNVKCNKVTQSGIDESNTHLDVTF